MDHNKLVESIILIIGGISAIVYIYFIYMVLYVLVG